MRKSSVLIGWIGVLSVLLMCGTALALTPEQILLIVNKNEPAGRELADFYAQQRHLPDGHICELDLPNSNDISFDDYERKVVPAVRAFLREHHLESNVICLLSFYGVPLRIENRVNSKEDQAELDDLQRQLGRIVEQVEPTVDDLAKLAGLDIPQRPDRQTTPPGTPRPFATELQILGSRAGQAIQRIGVNAQKLDDAQKRQELEDKVKALMRPLLGPMNELDNQVSAAAVAGGGSIPADSPAGQAMEKLLKFRAQFDALQERRFDAASRRQLRDLTGDNLGPFDLAHALVAQIDYLATERTGASLDNELALLWWTNYPRSNWIANPLFYANNVAPPKPVLMTMRLDASQTQIVRRIIVDSIKTENQGLKGCIVIDSQGKAAIDANGRPSAYGQYDQTLRNLADLVKTKTRLEMTFDEKNEVLPADSVKNVALYVGWYSLGKYIPCCQFSTGAVGFHIASATMLQLHHPYNGDWVEGMLDDGICGSLGPVNEPYLQAFPKADDFFPVLMTGKLPLAEVYWRTTPLVSWMIGAVGDPLYTPYKTNPAISVDDVPLRLRGIFSKPMAPMNPPESPVKPPNPPATRPASPPAP